MVGRFLDKAEEARPPVSLHMERFEAEVSRCLNMLGEWQIECLIPQGEYKKLRDGPRKLRKLRFSVRRSWQIFLTTMGPADHSATSYR